MPQTEEGKLRLDEETQKRLQEENQAGSAEEEKAGEAQDGAPKAARMPLALSERRCAPRNTTGTIIRILTR